MSNLGSYQTMVVDAYEAGGPEKCLAQHENMGLVAGFGLATTLFSAALFIAAKTLEIAIIKKYKSEQLTY